MTLFLTLVLYLIFIGTISCLMMNLSGNKGKNKVFVLTCATICGLLAAFRGTTGSDSAMYIAAFCNGSESVFRWQEFEIGFVVLINILKQMGASYHMMFFVMAFFSAYCVFSAIAHERSYIDTSVASLIYASDLYFFGLNGMRQHLAVCLCLYAFVLFFDKKYMRTLLLIVIAILFHKSALMCLVIYMTFVIYKSKYKKMIFSIVVVILLLLVANRELMGKMVYIITKSSYYASYITRDAETGTTIFKYYVKCIPIAIMPLLCFEDIEKNNKMLIFILFMYMGIILSSLGAVTATQVSRLGMYFSNMKIFVLGYCAKRSLPIKSGVLVSSTFNRKMICAYFLLMFYYSYFYRGFSHLVPYGQSLR